MIEIKTIKIPNHPLGWQVIAHETENLGHEARLAIQFAGQMLEADPTLRPDKVAVHACDVTSQLMAEMRRRGWITSGPTIAQVEEWLNPRVKPGVIFPMKP